MSSKKLKNLSNANSEDDEGLLINEEEQEDTIQEEFTNSKLSLNVEEEKKVDEFTEETGKDTSLLESKKEGVMSSEQEETLKNGEGIPQEIESYGTPPTIPTPPIGNLTPQNQVANIEVDEITEIKGTEMIVELQEETTKKEDDDIIQQTKTTAEEDQQLLSSMPIQHPDLGEMDVYGTPPNVFPDNLKPEKTSVTDKNLGIGEITLVKKNELSSEPQELKKEEDDALQTEANLQIIQSDISPVESKNDQNDIQLITIEKEQDSYGTPPTKVHPDIKETDSSPPVPTVNPTPEEEQDQPAWMKEKEKCLKATIEERKREGNPVELSDIKTWPEYFNENLNIGPELAEPEASNICNKVSIWRGDITTLLIDAIVNAANEKLLGGAGVDGAIHAAAGPLLKKECFTFGGRFPGESVITGAYDLPARYVIHTVGPRGEKKEKLKKCYLGSLQLLIENNLRSIAFPCISTGIFGYPNDKAAEVVLETIRAFLEENHEKIDRVILCLFLEKDVEIYQNKMKQHFPMMGGRTKSMAEEQQPGFPQDVVSGNTSIPGESGHSVPLPEMKYHTDSLEYEEKETERLIPAAQNGSIQSFWKIMLPCCFKSKTS